MADVVVARDPASFFPAGRLEVGGPSPWSFEGGEEGGYLFKPFALDWFDGEGNMLLFFRAVASDQCVLLNSYIGGKWGRALTIDEYPFPLQPDTPFRLLFEVLSDRFRIFVNDGHLCDFAHRAEPAVNLVRSSTFLWRLESNGAAKTGAGGERGYAITPQIVPGNLSLPGGWRHSWVVPADNPPDPEPLTTTRLFAVVGTWMEEDIIEATVTNCFEQGCERVYVVDNGSVDHTVARARQAGATVASAFRTERYDEAERVREMQSVVDEVSAARGRSTSGGCTPMPTSSTMDPVG